MRRKKFQVSIMHGHSNEYLGVKSLVAECGFSPRILIEEYSADTIFENLRNLIWDHVHCVIVILSKDDLMDDGNMRARQNVIFELGYCFGAFDSLPSWAAHKPKHALIIMAEKGVELFADIQGLTHIEYERGKLSEKRDIIVSSLEKSYTTARKYYLLDFLWPW